MAKKVHIQLRDNGSYRVRVNVRLNGEIVAVTSTYWSHHDLTPAQNLKAVEMMGDMLDQKLKAKIQVKQAGQSMTFAEYCESRYLPQATTCLAPATFEFHQKTLRKIFYENFGDFKIKDFERGMVRIPTNMLSKKINKNKVSMVPVAIKPQTIKSYTAVMRAVLRMAVEDGFVETDPFIGRIKETEE